MRNLLIDILCTFTIIPQHTNVTDIKKWSPQTIAIKKKLTYTEDASSMCIAQYGCQRKFSSIMSTIYFPVHTGYMTKYDSTSAYFKCEM